MEIDVTRRPSHVLAAGALLALLAVPGFGQGGMVQGTVVDPDERPVAGVEVTVTCAQLSSFKKSLTTDKRGNFRLRFQPNQTQYQFDFLFERAGYESFSVPLSPSATQQIRERWVMEESRTEIVESHGDLAAVVTGSTNVAVEAFNAGLSAQREGDLDVARTRYEEALAADPDLGPAHMALAQVLLDQAEYETALERAERAIELDTSRAEALRVKRQALRALGRDEEADAVATALEDADEAEAQARRLYNEAGQAFQADDPETALAKFQQAAELDPSLTDAHHAIATLELAKGNHEASAKAAERALALGSEDIRTLRVLYDAYAAMGRTEELAEIAPRLAAVDPDYGGAKLVEQAGTAWNAGQAEKAAALSRLALAIDASLAKAYYFIGLDHISRGENSEAKAALRKFIDLAPDDPEAATAEEMITYVE